MKYIFLLGLVLFSFSSFGQQALPDSIVIHVDYCRNPQSEYCLQMKANNSCKDGSGLTTFRQIVHKKQCVKNGVYVAQNIFQIANAALAFLNISEINEAIQLVKIFESIEYEIWYFQFEDLDGRKQLIGLMLPNLDK